MKIQFLLIGMLAASVTLHSMSSGFIIGPSKPGLTLLPVFSIPIFPVLLRTGLHAGFSINGRMDVWADLSSFTFYPAFRYHGFWAMFRYHAGGNNIFGIKAGMKNNGFYFSPEYHFNTEWDFFFLSAGVFADTTVSEVTSIRFVIPAAPGVKFGFFSLTLEFQPAYEIIIPRGSAVHVFSMNLLPGIGLDLGKNGFIGIGADLGNIISTYPVYTLKAWYKVSIDLSQG